METIRSDDGTTIAFDRIGAGPPIVLVAGASCDRHVDDAIAESLGESFTVLNYDRRGRGDSADTAPYDVHREIEDADSLDRLLGNDDRDGAMALFLGYVGLPDQAIQAMRSSPFWQANLALAPTLAYDAAVMGDGRPPVAALGSIAVPTLVLTGDRSPEFLRAAGEAAAGAIPGARSQVLSGQDHAVQAGALAPVVAEFVGR